MEKFINWLENSFQPKMSVVNTNVWVVTLKDSMLQVLPMIFVGSIFCLGTVLESFVELPFSFLDALRLDDGPRFSVCLVFDSF